MMNRDQREGRFENLKGRFKQAVGVATGDKAQEAEGATERAKGSLKEATGRAEGSLKDATERAQSSLKDATERAQGSLKKAFGDLKQRFAKKTEPH